MKRKLAVVAFVGAMVLLLGSLHATEYFVGKTGADANDGKSRQTAFLTIQKGVDALQPGDVLTIGPGEYFENVERTDIGSMDVDTVIRAEIPGTALLRGDIPAPEFKKVEGFRFVYSAKCDKKPDAIIEHHQLYILSESASPSELEFDPGAFHYDEASKTLYLSNRDLASPADRRYTMPVSGKNGLVLRSPKRVIIDGLAATGFHSDWGILLGEPVSCTVRNCVSFLNVGGIVLQPNEGLGSGSGGTGNIVENCVCYGNRFGGIVRYGANNDIIRNCHTYRNGHSGEHFGIMHYATMTGPLYMRNNIAWGQNFNYSVKQGHQQERLENCVGLGFIRIATEKMSHNLLEGSNEYDRGGENVPADTVAYQHEKGLDWDFEFADHLNLDFRLQSDSRFRGAAPDGSDRGPYQYEANVFYVSSAGDDAADGLSMRKSWRTLARAFKSLRPGDTVYLAEGQYVAAPLNNIGDGTSPVRILGRGRGTIVISGEQTATGCSGVVFERLNFADGLALVDSRDLGVKNCTFFGKDDGLNGEKVDGLKVAHSVFTDVPLTLANSKGVELSGNIYANAGKPAVRLDSADSIRYSDYNNYQNTAPSWEVNGAEWSLEDVQKQHDQYSQTQSPQFAMVDAVPSLQNADAFTSIGPRSTALGIHHEYEVTSGTETVKIYGPFLQSASDTTANIEWWMSGSADLELVWGYKGGAEKREQFRTGKRFTSYTITGLEPGKEYQFKIRTGNQADAGEPVEQVVSFKTADKPADPRTFYVAPDGDDANDGLSREQAFKTICRAANAVGPGDTVLIAGGDYHESVRIRATGTQGRPITFRSIEGEKANIHGIGLSLLFELNGKSDYNFDGLYFREVEHWAEGFLVRNSPRVKITRCFDIMVKASNSPDLLIRNCLLYGGWTTVSVSSSPGAVIENNVFIMAILRQLGANGDVLVRRNIICENPRNKTHLTLVQLSRGVKESDNCFYMRWPVEERLEINELPLPQYKAQTGSTSFAVNPMMPGVTGFRAGWQASSDKDWDQYFATNPEVILRGVGLQPEAFSDFKFETDPWPYDRAWAEKFLEASNAADALVQAGNDKDAVAAYTDIVKEFPLSERLKADVLERAFYCAERLKDYDRAMELAEAIPIEMLSTRAQMRVMLAREQYAELLKKFDYGEGEQRYYIYRHVPELEDVIVDIYDYRSQAYAHTGDLVAAEVDLKTVNANRSHEMYTAGEVVHDKAWLRLGDFYRTQLKDDERALEAYEKVCSRTTWARYDPALAKPVSTGATETLVKATDAACDILRKQGKLDRVKELQDSLKKAQADAAAALRQK